MCAEEITVTSLTHGHCGGGPDRYVLGHDMSRHPGCHSTVLAMADEYFTSILFIYFDFLKGLNDTFPAASEFFGGVWYR